MAKQRKVATLEQVAEEMNEVMAYGCNEAGELVEPSEQIDTELSEKALLRVIKDRCKEDLRAGDEGSFSPEVWDWFIDNNLTPEPNDGLDVDMDKGEDGPVDDGTESDDANDDPEDTPPDDNDDNEPDEDERKPRKIPPAKVKREANADRADNEQKRPSKPQKTERQANTRSEDKKPQKQAERESNSERGEKPKQKRESVSRGRPQGMATGGNEQFAVDMVKKGKKFPDFYQAFIDLYAEHKPDASKTFVRSRAKTYWNIAHKKLGKTTPPAELPEDTKKPASKEQRADNKRKDKEDADTGRSSRRSNRR